MRLSPRRPSAFQQFSHGRLRLLVSSGRFDHGLIPGPPLPVLEWVGWCHRSKLPCGASGDNYRHVSQAQKEIVKNGRTDYRAKGDPWRVNVHDFEDKELGKVVALWRVRYDHQCRLRGSPATRTGAPRRDLPDEFGKWHNVYATGLADGGRLILPMTSDQGFGAKSLARIERAGAVFRIERRGKDYLAYWISGVAIFPCAGNRDEVSERALAESFAKGGWQKVTRLYRNQEIPEERCWMRIGVVSCLQLKRRSD